MMSEEKGRETVEVHHTLVGNLVCYQVERGSGEKECKRGKGMPRRVEGVGGRQLVKERRIR
jgi:hypothetical protein